VPVEVVFFSFKKHGNTCSNTLPRPLIFSCCPTPAFRRVPLPVFPNGSVALSSGHSPHFVRPFAVRELQPVLSIELLERGEETLFPVRVYFLPPGCSPLSARVAFPRQVSAPAIFSFSQPNVVPPFLVRFLSYPQVTLPFFFFPPGKMGIHPPHHQTDGSSPLPFPFFLTFSTFFFFPRRERQRRFTVGCLRPDTGWALLPAHFFPPFLASYICWSFPLFLLTSENESDGFSGGWQGRPSSLFRPLPSPDGGRF